MSGDETGKTQEAFRRIGNGSVVLEPMGYFAEDETFRLELLANADAGFWFPIINGQPLPSRAFPRDVELVSMRMSLGTYYR